MAFDIQGPGWRGRRARASSRADIEGRPSAGTGLRRALRGKVASRVRSPMGAAPAGAARALGGSRIPLPLCEMASQTSPHGLVGEGVTLRAGGLG